ncbi:MAG: terpene synthase family protein [Archangium sp.]|nr:terpene synthase family protein [Archangium sp.]
MLTALEAWAQRFPAMGGARLKSMARSCAAACEGASDDSVLQLAVFCMILFGIDDLGDRALAPLPDEEIDQQLGQLEAIVAAGGTSSFEPPVGAPGQVFRALSGFCRDLSTRQPAYRLFARHLVGMLRGMREELAMSRAFSTRGELPGWDAYVELGTRTVGIPPVGAVMLALRGPAEALDSARAERAVEQLLLAAGRCIRFANDLRSYAREVFEGKPNSVSLQLRALACTEVEARAVVAAARDAEDRALPALVAALPLELLPWGQSFHRHTSFIRDWYAIAELHDEVPHFKEGSSVLTTEGAS